MTSPKDMLAVSAVTLAIRIAIFAWGYLLFDFGQNPHESLVSIWTRWDAQCYLKLAEFGYNRIDTPENLSFTSLFPYLFPLLVKLMAYLLHLPFTVAGLLTANLWFIVASCLVFQLMMHEFQDRSRAWWAVILMQLFPTSYFGQVAYSESLYLALSAGALLAIRKFGRNNLGAILGGFALLSRLQGATLATIYLCSGIKHRRLTLIFSSMVIFSGITASYLAVQWVVFGDWFYFIHSRASEATTNKLGMIPFAEPYQTLLRIVQSHALLFDQEFMFSFGWGALLLLFHLITFALLIRKLPAEYNAYWFSSLVFLGLFTWNLGLARYLFPLFPLYMALACINSKALKGAIALIFTVGLLHFSQRFSAGPWAF